MSAVSNTATRKSRKGAKRNLRRGGAMRVFGEAFDDAHQVQLQPNQSIAGFMCQMGSECVARERYSDGSLFFTGAPTPSQCEELGITAKPGWKSELRHSRTLNLAVQPMDGDVAPELTLEEGLRIVKESCLWEDLPNIELVRVANGRQRSAHVFVQYEGQGMAQRRVNAVDGQRYEANGTTFFVHSMQINASFEYVPVPEEEGAEVVVPLVWRNPEFVGLRCVTLTQEVEEGTVIDDAALVQLAQEAGGLSLVSDVRRVDTKTAVHVMVQASTVEGAVELFDKMRAVHTAKVSVDWWCSREKQTDVSDRLIWSNPAAGWDLSDCEDETDSDDWAADTFDTASTNSRVSETQMSVGTSMADACESMPETHSSDAQSELPVATPTNECHIEYDTAMLLEFFQ
eukprot:TRINITY_DN13765_c0_g1_i1.p1 TRINITY_DN13765_c0_g1~~TRINITY_DN13765_c0_g1_i1.p1  ORF type:complete len:400 (+),score=165.52 TRINITY_DN13765_c0_g1_i1:163-1362(+)